MIATGPKLNPIVALPRRPWAESILASCYESAVIARAVKIILGHERVVIPVSAHSEKYGVTVSLPRRAGRSGVLDEFEIEVDQEEQIGLEKKRWSVESGHETA